MAFPLLTAAWGLSQLAPMIGKWLGRADDPHSIAEPIIKIAQEITGTSTVSDLLTQLQSNPNHISEFHRAILEWERKMEESITLDRNKARERDIALIHAGHKNRRADIMVISAAVGLIVCLSSLAWFSKALPGEAVGIISTISGIFGACLKDAYAFEFGSSRGSKDKDWITQMIYRK